MKPKNTPTTFTLANKSLRSGEYIEAISLYSQAIDEHSVFKEHIQHNIQTAIRRLSGLSPATLKSYAVTLTPVSQIEHDTKDARYWHSLGEDPHFQLRFDDAADLDAGWYRIDLLVDSLEEKNTAKFYLDYGQGYAEDSAFNLPCQKLTLETRVVHVRKHAHAVRFDPKETSGRFRIMTLQWRKVEESSAIEQMFAQLADKSGSTSHAARQAMRGDFEQIALTKNIAPREVLYDKYNELFKFIPGQVSYEEWIEHIEKPSLPSPAEARELFERLHHKPLISVVVPTYNTDEDYLRACVNSVIAQSYQNWELCIADDASPKPHVRQILEAYAVQDARIKIVLREKNGHISHASNSALALADGEFIALLDHDDALPKHALLFVAQAINANPNAQIIYSDEDKISADGQRFAPHFKSDWNPDLFYSHNYVSHLGVYRRDLLERIGGFRAGVEGSQDYDLLLRCLPHVADQQIVHIPRVLYHWRTVEGSTALASAEKSYTTEAGIKALTDYFAQKNPAVTIERGAVPNTYRARWPIPEPAPLVSLLIPTRDRRNLVEVAVRSILEKSTYTNYEILILDNGSVEADTLAFFEQIQKEDRRVLVLRYDHPFNYSAINNFGARHAKGEIIGLINNDIEVISPEWLSEMVSHALRPEIGCVGAKLYYSNDTIQHAGVVLGIGGIANHPHKKLHRSSLGYFSKLQVCQNYIAVTAACLAIRKSTYLELNGLDEENLKIAYSDVDLCLKSYRAGYLNLWTPYAELYHHESISRGADNTPENLSRLLHESEHMNEQWGELIDNDPYYNPNLTKENEHFSLCSSYSKSLEFDGKILYSWRSPEEKNRKENVCIFVNFDKNSELHEYVNYYLRELKESFDIVFVSTSENLHRNDLSIQKLQETCNRIIVRKNEGYDFGSWRLGIETLGDELKNYNSLLLCNDSVYGPFHSADEILRKFHHSGLDAMSATDSREIKYHLQSYFILYRKKLFLSAVFRDFWSRIKCHSRKWDIIEKYEIGFSQKLINKGFRIGAYCDSSEYPPTNICHTNWKDLIERQRFPFIKIELLRDNPINIDISDWKSTIEANSNFITTHIEEHLSKAHKRQ